MMKNANNISNNVHTHSTMGGAQYSAKRPNNLLVHDDGETTENKFAL